MDQGDGTPTWDSMAGWSEAEKEWWWMGPFPGGIPGLVRRVRRMLDVSQRGLATLLGVSQSVVARWETARTSPRVSALQRLLRLVGGRISFHDDETGEEITPMRADGARKHGGSRYPAHVDLRVTGWWVPREVEYVSCVEQLSWLTRSRARRDPAVRFRLHPHARALQRLLRGTPVDHPGLHQLAVEAEHLDERREDRLDELSLRRLRRSGTGPGGPPRPAA